MKAAFLPRKGLVLAVLAAVALSACSAEKAFDNTVDATLWTGKTAVRAGAGVVKLGAKGAGAVARAATDAE
ncbi:hypothetical protein [Tropicibacter oceani]|uniref:Entericidin EcnAB n=1 Tax=Tropicibacter oceani TaxID=3058420 RepID=A0ABY8QK26_9RHOB|nr:hypothetical protein [Tropicibacter oceani]WGW04358.1 hypothetical protein QF118_02105 [Tropicibacter oceani]